MAHVTVNDEASKVSYTVGGTPDSSFEIPFTFFALTDIAVYQDGTKLTYTTEYTVAGDAGTEGGYLGGDVTLVTPASNAVVVVVREVPYDRTTDFPTSGPFNITQLNTELDRQVALTQQVKEIADRAIHFPVVDSASLTAELPAAATRANKALVFDADGNVAASTDDYEDQATAAAASAAAASASASAASTSASTASTQASNASTSATNAATAKTAAETAETNAETAQAAAEAARDLAQGYATAADVAKIEWQGAWLTATAYALNDAVSNGGSSYICISAHTSGTFATDLAALKWEVLAAKGTDGAGSGDLLAANNLSDLASAATARTNLGLGTVATLAVDTDTTLAANSDTSIASQKAVKTYADTKTTLAAVAASLLPFTNKGYITGRYYGGFQQIHRVETVVAVANRMYGIPYPVHETATFTKIGIEVTSAAGSLARLGIYRWDPVAGNRTKVIDAGTVSTASTGLKEATISQSIAPGMYILACVFDNTPTVRAGTVQNPASNITGVTTPGTGVGDFAFYTAHTFGALPDPFGTLTFYDVFTSSTAPSMWLRT